MKNIAYIITISFTLLFLSAQSQVSGYLGKTFEVSYAAQLSTGIQYSRILGLGAEEETIPFLEMPQNIHSFRLEKVISKHSSLLVNYSILNQRMSEHYFVISELDNEYCQQMYYDAIINEDESDLDIQSRIISLKHVVYTNGWLAPLGTYFSYGISMVTTNYNNFTFQVSDKDNCYYDGYYYNSTGVKVDSYKTDNQVSKRFLIDFSLGRKWMLTNYVTFHLAFNTSLTLKRVSLFDDDDDHYDKISTTRCNYYYSFNRDSHTEKVIQGISNTTFFNIEAGFGILIF